MSAALVLVWLGTTSARAAREPDLDSWAEVHYVALEDFAPDAQLLPVAHDDAAASRIEESIAEARATGGPAEAAAPLREAETLLRAHPDLPESAWLMAEILRTRAALGILLGNEAGADLERRADELEGKRAEPFDSGAVRTPAGGERTSPAIGVSTSVPSSTEGSSDESGGSAPRATDEVYIDGLLSNPPSLSGGEHHVRIVRDGALAWAGWTNAAGFRSVRVASSAPCSAAELDEIDAGAARPKPRHAVSCPDWAVARALGDDRVEIARCHASNCGTFLPWKRGWGSSFELPVHRPWPPPKSNAWILWSAASVVAASAAGIALWQAGVFEGTPERQRVTTIVPPGQVPR